RVDPISPNVQKELVVSVLPAWSAYATIDLDQESLGFPAAPCAVKTALGLRTMVSDASQPPVARYSAVGFEAATITRFALAYPSPAPARATDGRPLYASGIPWPWSLPPSTTTEPLIKAGSLATGTGYRSSPPGSANPTRPNPQRPNNRSSIGEGARSRIRTRRGRMIGTSGPP